MSDKLPDSNPKTRYGVKKPSLALVPSAGLLHEALAFMDGADKYSPFNWRTDKVSTSVYVNAALRHILEYFNGENVDPESKHGAHHLGEARACLNIILDALACDTLIDDRPKPAPVGVMIRQFARGGAFTEKPIADQCLPPLCAGCKNGSSSILILEHTYGAGCAFSLAQR